MAGEATKQELDAVSSRLQTVIDDLNAVNANARKYVDGVNKEQDSKLKDYAKKSDLDAIKKRLDQMEKAHVKMVSDQISAMDKSLRSFVSAEAKKVAKKKR